VYRPAHLDEAELVAEEVERRVEIADADHRMQVFHDEAFPVRH
jgi:hypothetical protein